MRDKTTDPAADHPSTSGRPKPARALTPDKDAKLAAALRANLARRKAAMRQANAAPPVSPKPDQKET